MKEFYELVIIGGGPAGMTAAIYATRRGIDTLLVGQLMGGQTAWSADIENYLGFNMITGPELTDKFYQHVKRFDDDNAEFNLEVIAGAEVTKLTQSDQGFQVKLNSGISTTGSTVIITSGKIPRLLKIPGEEKLFGKGVTFCATCDAPLYRGKTVAVVGGGNSALDAALQLVKIAQQVYLLTINEAMQGEQVMIDHLRQASNLKLYNNTTTVDIKGNEAVTGVVIKNKQSGEVQTLAVEGVFEEVGSVPAVDFCRGLVEINANNEIVVNERMQTNVPGIFAAGDVTPVPYKQIVVAAGEGCKAALEAYDYLVRLKHHLRPKS